MAKVTPDMSDAQVIEVLKTVGAGNQAALREAMKDASPRQAFVVAIPWGIKAQPDVAATLAGIEGSVLWVVEGEGGGKFALCLSGGKIDVTEGDKPDATATVTLDVGTWKELASGESNPQAAFMSGKIQIAGDLSLIMQIQGALPMG
ncbi:MAG TPA: SCP2 sterol-binding domain-containing protein [bacterium]|nr:SCP2 sterol-binding domain-containing protein [bacterium]